MLWSSESTPGCNDQYAAHCNVASTVHILPWLGFALWCQSREMQVKLSCCKNCLHEWPVIQLLPFLQHIPPVQPHTLMACSLITPLQTVACTCYRRPLVCLQEVCSHLPGNRLLTYIVTDTDAKFGWLCKLAFIKQTAPWTLPPSQHPRPVFNSFFTPDINLVVRVRSDRPTGWYSIQCLNWPWFN
jgi:hypothetical protein